MTQVLQQISDAAEGEAHSGGAVISIVSGKGGVGKTNLALNLGIQLARRVPRVVLLDADIGLANADILLNIAPLGDVTNLLDPSCSLDDVLVEGPGGLCILCGVSGAARGARARTITPADCVAAIERLRRACDLLLVDCGAGLSPTTLACALASDRLIIATTPEPTALADGYATLKRLANEGLVARVGVVVNMARSRREGDAVAGRLARVARQFLGLSVENLGFVSTDGHVPRAVRARIPVVVQYPNCAASTCVNRICARLAPATRAGPRAAGVWSRVAGLFL